VIVSVDDDPVGFGLNVAVDPLGKPLTLRFTDPVNPLMGVTLTVYDVVLPCTTD
jgi:hypothetical protein